MKIRPYRKAKTELVGLFQHLFDATNVRVRTRDRRGMVPLRLEVSNVIHLQNHGSYLDYMRGKTTVEKNI